MKTNKIKVAIHCNANLNHFIGDIEKSLSKNFEVKLGDNSDIQKTYELMKWSDVSFFEWVDDTFVRATTLPKACKIVVRMHRYEAFTAAIENANWKMVDELILVSKVLDPVLSGRLEQDYTVIENGVDLNKFKFDPKKKLGKEIVMLSYINHRKNIPYALIAMSELIAVDPEYTLSIVGDWQNLELKNYVEHYIDKAKIQNNVTISKWMHEKDVPGYLKSKSILLSTSMHESFGYSIAEGMACGLIPLIHWFPGAETIWPEKYLFLGVTDFLEKLRDQEANYNPQAYREYIQNNFTLPVQLEKIKKLIVDVYSRKEKHTGE